MSVDPYQSIEYNQGWNAARFNRSIDSNPYKYPDQRFLDWREGWNDYIDNFYD